jgi:hypothetical protein
MLSIFSTPELIRHPWQLKTVVFLHWCLMCAVSLKEAQKALWHLSLASAKAEVAVGLVRRRQHRELAVHLKPEIVAT